MKTVIVLHSEYLGRGDDKLGAMMIGSFLRKLWAHSEKPDAIIFYNSAIKLLLKGSAVLDALTGLADSGVDLVACSTCINYYNAQADMRIGRIGEMPEIISLLLGSE
jgi:intracellular sulfur oxidation DsrE/DsrF family protein